MKRISLKVWLGLSLALNLFLIGLTIGVIGFGWFNAPQRPRPGANLWAATLAVPEADRMALRQTLRAHAVAAQPEVKAARQARRQAAALVAAQVYDRAAVAAALAEARGHEMKARADLDETLASALVKLPVDERKALALALIRTRPGNLRAQIRQADGEGAQRSAAPQPAPPQKP